MRRLAHSCARLAATGLVWSAILLAPPIALAAKEQTGGNSTDFVAKMQQWQTEMSEKFRDAYRNLRGVKGKSSAPASIDLREQNDSYTVRLNLPERDLEKVKVNLEGDTLHIVAPADDKSGTYEQSLQLSDVSPGAVPQIERKQKDNLIVITVAKSAGSAQATPEPTIPDPALVTLQDWDRDVLARMEKMRREMDRIFADSFKDFRSLPAHRGIFDEARFGSALDLAEEGNDYVVRAYLPAREMKNVNVKVDGRVLKIEASAEENGEKVGGLVRQKAAYSQLLTLPGPVQADKMQVDRKEGMLVVRLPKETK